MVRNFTCGPANPFCSTVLVLFQGVFDILLSCLCGIATGRGGGRGGRGGGPPASKKGTFQGTKIIFDSD